MKNVYILVWLLFASLSCLVKLVPDLLFLCNHGKRSSLLSDIDESKQKSSSSSTRLSLDALLEYFKLCKVPKAWFLHMYLLAIANVAYCLYHQSIPPSINEGTELGMPLIYLLLLGLHCVRRAYECVFVFNFGRSQMHVASYVVGLVHYLLVPWTLMTSTVQLELQSLSMADYCHFGVYVLGMVSQHHFHRVLAFPNKGKKEKEKESGKSNKEGRVYIFPSGFGFDYVCCPHYSAEIMIYISFYLLDTSNQAIGCLLVWVVSNLAVVSDDTYKWYCAEFPMEVKKRGGWSRLCPFVY